MSNEKEESLSEYPHTHLGEDTVYCTIGKGGIDPLKLEHNSEETVKGTEKRSMTIRFSEDEAEIFLRDVNKIDNIYVIGRVKKETSGLFQMDIEIVEPLDFKSDDDLIRVLRIAKEQSNAESLINKIRSIKETVKKNRGSNTKRKEPSMGSWLNSIGNMLNTCDDLLEQIDFCYSDNKNKTFVLSHLKRIVIHAKDLLKETPKRVLEEL